MRGIFNQYKEKTKQLVNIIGNIPFLSSVLIIVLIIVIIILIIVIIIWKYSNDWTGARCSKLKPGRGLSHPWGQLSLGSQSVKVLLGEGTGHPPKPNYPLKGIASGILWKSRLFHSWTGIRGFECHLESPGVSLKIKIVRTSRSSASSAVSR